MPLEITNPSCAHTEHGNVPQLADYDVELPESAFYLCRRHAAELVGNRDSAVQRVRLLDEAGAL